MATKPKAAPKRARPSKPAKPAKPKTPRKKSVATVLRAAETIVDATERASYLESMFDAVAKPGDLVRPWFEAMLSLPASRDGTGERAIALCHPRETNAPFLEAIGRELARRNFSDAAIEVFRMAIAGGSTDQTSAMLLGYLLVRQGNEEGVPLLERAVEESPYWILPRKTLAGWLVTRDPERVMEILADPADGEEWELRAMASEALGRAAQAAEDSVRAIGAFDSELDARLRLAEWHTDYARYERAFSHARALRSLREDAELDPKKLDDIDEVIVRAYRDTASVGELVEWLRERTRPFSLRLGWYVNHALTGMHPNPDPDLAVRAARDVAAAYREQGNASDARCWEVRAAGTLAKHGDLSVLDQLVESGLDDDPEAWVEVSNRYMSLDLYDAASAANDRALMLDPNSSTALAALGIISLVTGDGAALHRVGMALAAQKPLWHQGPEYLARSFARRLDAKAALMHSERALAMAPYCPNAWMSRAEALIVADRVDEARRFADRSQTMRAGEHGDEILVILAALAGDGDRLERELAHRFRYLPALPYPEYLARLREVAARG